MDCLSDDAIEALARAGEAPAGHALDCGTCRTRLETARAELALIDELRAGRASLRAPPPDAWQVAGFEIQGEIRRGGQGIVYRALQIAAKRPVALKVLLAGGEASARERWRFEREIELAARLDHPGIVRLYDSGVSDGRAWCAMELIDGRQLDAWMRETNPSLRERVQLARKLASAVAHAHQRGVIHRDIKPANVLIDARGEPHVLDFGAALAREGPGERLRMTAPGEFLGTLAYAAPEQLRGSNSAIDTRTDVYALGLLCFELWTGRLPFEGDGGLAELSERVTSQPAPPPSSFDHEVDRDLDAITLKALATEPAERYGSAETFERDLMRYLSGEPVEARHHSLGYVLRKHLVRRRKAIAAGMALALIAGSLIGAWLRERQRAEHQGEQAALVRSVVQDLLAAADPQRMGGDARLLDVYEVLARELDAALQGAPDVQGEVELTIGDTYRRLLRAGEAVPHLRTALARFQDSDDRRELEIARASNSLALGLADLNQPEAIEAAESALRIRERELPAGDARIAQSRRTLALALLKQFRDVDSVRARGLLEQALGELRALHGEQHPEVAETQLLLIEAGADFEPRQLDAMFLRALAILERSSIKDPRSLWALNAYAAFLQQQQRFDEARALLDRAGALAQELFGNALAGDMLRRHARLEFARGNPAGAELLSRQAVARELERWAARRADLAEPLRSLARRVEQPGPAGFEPPFAEAFNALRALEGDGAFELAQWSNGICMVLHALGRGAATETMLRESLHICCRALGQDCPVRLKTIELLASELAAQKRGGEAIELLEESLATFERIEEPATPSADRARELLALCRDQAATSDGRSR